MFRPSLNATDSTTRLLEKQKRADAARTLPANYLSFQPLIEKLEHEFLASRGLSRMPENYTAADFVTKLFIKRQLPLFATLAEEKLFRRALKHPRYKNGFFYALDRLIQDHLPSSLNLAHCYYNPAIEGTLSHLIRDQLQNIIREDQQKHSEALTARAMPVLPNIYKPLQPLVRRIIEEGAAGIELTDPMIRRYSLLIVQGLPLLRADSLPTGKARNKPTLQPGFCYAPGLYIKDSLDRPFEGRHLSNCYYHQANEAMLSEMIGNLLKPLIQETLERQTQAANRYSGPKTSSAEMLPFSSILLSLGRKDREARTITERFLSHIENSIGTRSFVFQGHTFLSPQDFILEEVDPKTARGRHAKQPKLSFTKESADTLIGLLRVDARLASNVPSGWFSDNPISSDPNNEGQHVPSIARRAGTLAHRRHSVSR